MQVSSPRVCDIIIGKGGTGIYHPGNIFLRQQLTPIQIYYQKMEGHDKSVYLDIILKKIVASGRHFYKKDKESKKFRIVGLDEKQGGHFIIRKKILNILNAKITSTTATTAAVIASGNFKMREREEQLLQKLQHPNQQQLEDESTARESAFDESTATLPGGESAFDESTATLPNQCTNTTQRDQNASIVPPREIVVKLPITLKSREI